MLVPQRYTRHAMPILFTQDQKMVASEIATNGGTASPAAMDVTTKVKAFM